MERPKDDEEDWGPDGLDDDELFEDDLDDDLQDESIEEDDPEEEDSSEEEDLDAEDEPWLAEPASSTRISLKRSQVSADIVNMIGNLHQGASDGPERLEVGSFVTLSLEQLERGTKTLSIDEEVLESGTRVLEERRLLWILGPPDIGKMSFAQRLIVHSAERGRVERGVRVLLKAPLGPETRVDLLRLCKQLAKYRAQGCLLLIEDSPQPGNPCLADWGEELDGAKLQALEKTLVRTGCKLLLLSDASERLAVQGELEMLGAALTLTHPKVDALCMLMLAEARRALPRREDGERRLEDLQQQLAAERDRVGSVLATFPRVARFFHSHGAAILSGELSLGDALDRFEDLSLWLLQDLVRDMDDWCSVVALMLCQAERQRRGTPWFVFHQLRHQLRLRLERRLRRDDEAYELTTLLAPDLTRLGIDTAPSAFPDGMRVQFVDSNQGERLWQTVQRSGHGIAALLVPELTAIAEQRDLQPALRRAAAAALGRLGEVEPTALLTSVMESWEKRGLEDAHLLLGGLCCGVWGAREERYREYCLERLKRHMRADPPESSRIAAAALGHLGRADWRSALHGLQAAMPGLRRAIPDLAATSREIHQLMRQDERSRRLRDAVAVRLYLFALLPKKEWVRLEALQFGLVGLCFAGRSLEVLAKASEETEDPLEQAEKDIWLLISLWNQGLLEIVQQFSVRDEAGSKGRLNLVLASAWVSEEGVATLARFFSYSFRRGTRIAGPVGRLLRTGWLRLLADWSSAALEAPTARGLLAQLYRLLLRDAGEGSELRSAVFDSLQKLARRKRGSEKGDQISSFVRGVLSPSSDGEG